SRCGSPRLPSGRSNAMQHTASNVSRRSALRLFASAAGIALVAACQAPTPANPPTTAPAPAPAPKPTSPAAPATTSAPAAAGDRVQQAGFIPVGVAATSAAAQSPG